MSSHHCTFHNVLVFLFGIQLAFHLPAAENRVQLANGEWPPFNSEHLVEYGYTSHIITEAFKAVKYDVQYGFMPWKRAYEMAKNNPQWHGSLIWSKSEERENDFFFSDTVVQLDIVFFHKADSSFDWQQLSDLSSLKIGTTRGYFYGDEFATHQKNKSFNIDEASSDLLNLRKIITNRINVFPLVKEAGMYLIQQHQTEFSFDKLVFHPKPITSEKYYLILSRKMPENVEIMNQFNQGLAMIKSSGLYDKIIKDNLEGKYNKN